MTIELRVASVQKVSPHEHGLAAPQYLAAIIGEPLESFVHFSVTEELVTPDEAREIIQGWGDYHTPEQPLHHGPGERLFMSSDGSLIIDDMHTPYAG